MSQTAGALGQVFYQTETDPTWDQAKSVAFPIIADGQMRDYFIDLAQLTTLNGVLTRVRLDPTVAAGSDMVIDFIRITDSTDPWQAAPASLAPDPIIATFTSIASEDGFVTESAKDSGVGGTVSSTSTTMRLGDDSSNRATRMFMSFDTSSLPDNATIIEATLGITRTANPTGTIPIGVADSPWGDLYVDAASNGFGALGLSASDFEATATREDVSRFAWPAYSNGMTIYSRLEPENNDVVNRAGRTQFRVRYQNDDDNDGVADYMPYATGNATNAAQRPTLTIRYVIRPNLPGDYDGNAIVEDADRGVWRNHYGQSGPSVPGDGNGDGVVDAADYTVWRDNLAATAASAAAALAATDEPEVPLAYAEESDSIAPSVSTPTALLNSTYIGPWFGPEVPDDPTKVDVSPIVAVGADVALALLLVEDDSPEAGAPAGGFSASDEQDVLPNDRDEAFVGLAIELGYAL
jgi:hypothetical protein